jgi:L-seryl-tRNA(Ser) seleniumtransferase
MRALRVDKTVLAALAATLQLHRDPDQAAREVPVLALLTTPLTELEARGEKLAEQLRAIERVEHAELRRSDAYLGGGSLPTHAVPSVAIAARLRTGRPAVVPRTRAGAVQLDLRTVFEHQDAALVGAVRAAASGEAHEDTSR